MNLVNQSLPSEHGAFSLPAAPEPPVTEIRPPSGWQLVNVRELWQFRDLLYFLTWRDVKIRYKQTVLGAAWAVLQPALMMVVFTIFFGRMAKLENADIPYPLFAFAGLLPWMLFATAISNGGNSVIGSEKLITKIYFPRLAIPFASVGAALVDFAIAFGLLAIALFVRPVAPTWHIVLLPIVVALVFLAATGIGTLLAALNVNYRDFRYVIPFLVQVWMFATPSIYLDIFDASQVEQGGIVHWLVIANPMTGLVAAFRACVLGTPMPWGLLGSAAIVSVAMFVIGCFYYRRMEDGFADVI
jgi:lipopolysaccharide transport system permease protein